MGCSGAEVSALSSYRRALEFVARALGAPGDAARAAAVDAPRFIISSARRAGGRLAAAAALLDAVRLQAALLDQALHEGDCTGLGAEARAVAEAARRALAVLEGAGK